MCRQVYFTCTYCGARRFFMWEECSAYWARYQYIVIDRGNFDERPRLGIVGGGGGGGGGGTNSDNELPACGSKLQEPKYRHFRLGKCPRLPACPSLQEHIRQQQLQQQRGAQRRRSPRMLTAGGQEEGVNGGSGSGVESMAERQRREFADRWFRKRPLAGRQDGTADQPCQDGVEVGGDAPNPTECGYDAARDTASLSGKTMSVPTLSTLPPCSNDMSQSVGSSTVIESGSEVESCDWEELRQTMRTLRVGSAHSI